MRNHLFAAFVVGALLSAASLPAVSAASTKDAAATGTKKKSAAPKFIQSSSQEAPRDRERRLLRECKGRPNAGACSGFAS